MFDIGDKVKIDNICCVHNGKSGEIIGKCFSYEVKVAGEKGYYYEESLKLVEKAKDVADAIEKARGEAKYHNRTYYVEYVNKGGKYNFFFVTDIEPSEENFVCGVLPYGEIFISL